MHLTRCRICNKKSLTPILRLGKMPPVNYFPTKQELRKPQKRYPLNFCVCRNCGLTQLDEVVTPEKLFRNYHYLTSASQPLIEHFHSLAQECVHRHFVSKDSKVLDIGANDGTLLLEFKKHGVKTLGIDPSVNAVMLAEKVGIKVLPSFFKSKIATTVRKKYGHFNLITSTNVLAHTHDVRSFLKCAKLLLAPHGVLIFEFAHLLDMVVKNQFDVIYHEHVSYFSLRPLTYLLDMLDLQIFDAKKILTQGGSLRIYVREKKSGTAVHSPSLNLILQEEEDNHINEIATLQGFAKDVHQFRNDLRKLIFKLKKAGHKIVGFGAPAKGVILLNFCGLGASEIDYIVDSTLLKQGRFFPGSHIPVYAEQKLESDNQWDHILLLSWNFQEAIMRKLVPFRAKGTKVIIPFPKLRVV